MKYLAAVLLFCSYAHGAESFTDGVVRLAHEFVQRQDRHERIFPGAALHEQGRSYFGVAERNFAINSPWTEMREELETDLREKSQDAVIAWFEPMHRRQNDGSIRVSFPYIVKTNLPQDMLPAGVQPLKELSTLAVALPHEENARWELAADFPDDDLSFWQRMIGDEDPRRIEGHDGGAVLVARFGSALESQWRILEAYEIGKPVVSRPSFRSLHSAETQDTKILPFRPRCEDGVKK